MKHVGDRWVAYTDHVRMSTRDEYAEGEGYGIEWALADRFNHIPSTSELALLREETRSESRNVRAFYLGALRGYRSIVRTFERGRWGT